MKKNFRECCFLLLFHLIFVYFMRVMLCHTVVNIFVFPWLCLHPSLFASHCVAFAFLFLFVSALLCLAVVLRLLFCIARFLLPLFQLISWPPTSWSEFSISVTSITLLNANFLLCFPPPPLPTFSFSILLYSTPYLLFCVAVGQLWANCGKC